MSSNPFGFPDNATYRLMREELQRAEQLRRALGPDYVRRAIEDVERQRALLTALDWDQTFRAAREALRLAQEQRQSLWQLASADWALAARETARDIALQQQSLIEQQRELTGSMAGAMKVLQAQSSMLDTAFGVADFAARQRSLIDQIAPAMQLYGAIAQRMRMIDFATLRASADAVDSSLAAVAESVIEAQQLAEAMAATEDTHERAKLLHRFLEVLFAPFGRFGVNTVGEYENMGLFGLLSILSAILSFITASLPPAQSPEDKAAFAELNGKLDRMQAEERRYHDVKAERDQAFLAGMPRGQLSRAATLRRRPHRDGEIVFRADVGMELAIEKSEGRWRLVVFRDPLSDQLMRAWVYSTAIMSLGEPVE
ncbi:hypothetical protein KNJ79_07480 [Sphingopyxis indica]|uniref:hypothetical protein n=1 Tax=Sphingopyxis indica TaxID=436663 RepID=UPI002938F22D|nr:hypothetical protein [Sphingopyxis indica]WOF44736.1 hypothetical protein KNJ79_07480 [Sphingopyxis indica]